ncbi:MAG: patatin-like phospholipase family protein [Anaerolineae bacterium]
MSQTLDRRRVGLALGGGGARGFAHLGVIQVLEQEGVPVDCVAGTSVGSLVGAAYAAGLRGGRLLDLALKIRWRDVARPAWPRNGLVSFARMEPYIIRLLGDLTFAELEIPYAAVAADLVTGEEVILREGRLAPAVRASCSVPSVVTPLELDGRFLVDGGMINNLPISVVRDLGADIVLAVGLAAPPGDRPKGLLSTAITAIEHLLIKAGDDPATADVYIPLPFWGLASIVRLSKGEESVALGRQAAVQALPAIKAALS